MSLIEGEKIIIKPQGKRKEEIIIETYFEETPDIVKITANLLWTMWLFSKR